MSLKRDMFGKNLVPREGLHRLGSGSCKKYLDVCCLAIVHCLLLFDSEETSQQVTWKLNMQVPMTQEWSLTQLELTEAARTASDPLPSPKASEARKTWPWKRETSPDPRMFPSNAYRLTLFGHCSMIFMGGATKVGLNRLKLSRRSISWDE